MNVVHIAFSFFSNCRWNRFWIINFWKGEILHAVWMSFSCTGEKVSSPVFPLGNVSEPISDFLILSGCRRPFLCVFVKFLGRKPCLDLFMTSVTHITTDYYCTRCLSSPNICYKFLTCLRELTKDFRHVLSKRNPRHTT